MPAVADSAGDASEEALELAEEIADLCDEDDEQIATWKKEKHNEFFESVKAKSADIAATVRETGFASTKQVEALRNILAGVKKWID